jgi:hypothetical protein
MVKRGDYLSRWEVKAKDGTIRYDPRFDGQVVVEVRPVEVTRYNGFCGRVVELPFLGGVSDLTSYDFNKGEEYEVIIRVVPEIDGDQYSPGSLVDAKFLGSEQYSPGKIVFDNGDGTFDVEFDDGDCDKAVPHQDIRVVSSFKEKILGEHLLARVQCKHCNLLYEKPKFGDTCPNCKESPAARRPTAALAYKSAGELVDTITKRDGNIELVLHLVRLEDGTVLDEVASEDLSLDLGWRNRTKKGQRCVPFIHKAFLLTPMFAKDSGELSRSQFSFPSLETRVPDFHHLSSPNRNGATEIRQQPPALSSSPYY